MTKSERLSDKISELYKENTLFMLSNKGKNLLNALIKEQFEQIHNEAVDATVMAENKKNFVKPQYNDQI